MIIVIGNLISFVVAEILMNQSCLFVCTDVQTSPAASSPFIIVGGVFLGLVGLVAMVIFLAYLRRVFSHRDRVSVTSMVPLDSGSHDGPVANGNGHATFVHLEDSQLVSQSGGEGRVGAHFLSVLVLIIL